MPDPAPNVSPRSLVSVSALRTWYPVYRGVLQRLAGYVKAVDGISFELPQQQTLALVGESGCGKTTAGKSLLRLVEPRAGTVRFDGVDLTALPRHQLLPYRRQLQLIYQDPYSSLDPRQTVRDIVREGLDAHRLGTPRERDRKAADVIRRVGLPPDALDRYPHEFSGGQRQRIGIARAVAVEPRFIVCDEPVSALDVSIQAQILNLLRELQHDFGLTYLFITHDLSVVEYMADEVAVMYLGKIVEHAPVEQLFDDPVHPYTKVLLTAIPRVSPARRQRRALLQGEVPSPYTPPAGCPFHPRCPHAVADCAHHEPDLLPVADRHLVRCLRTDTLPT